MNPVITLTTDFGSKDSYAAQMKGVILAINPRAALVDVTHDIPPQNVRRAAAIVDEIAGVFPAGTIHLVVVDPGVGTDRDLVGVEMAGLRFVAPDNGVLSSVARRCPPGRIVRLSNRKFWRPDVSHTFHGRDIMAPVAAHWSLGLDLGEFGGADSRPLVALPESVARREGGRIAGEVLWADAFGNLITNIDESLLPAEHRPNVKVRLGGGLIHGVESCYAAREAGELVALIGSSGRLEIAVNQGSASRRLKMSGGEPIEIIGHAGVG
jgi:S-adenosylmethionine hydrolase